SYTLKLRCPFYLTGGLLRLDATCPGAGDAIEVTVDQKAGDWKKALSATEVGRKVYAVDLDGSVAQPSVGRHEYTIKIDLKGKAVLHKLHLRSWFQHNAMAAPHLMPGSNAIKVEFATAETLAKDLTLIYRYREAPQWKGDIKTIQHEVKKSGE